MPDSAPPGSPGGHNDLMDLAVPYALDAVSDTEGAEIEHRVRAAGPGAARGFEDTVRAVREAMGALSVLDAQPPPARVEARILAALDSLPGGRSDLNTSAGADGPRADRPDILPEAGIGATESAGDELARARRRRAARRLAAAAAAVVVIAVGIVIGIGVFEGTENGPGATISAQQVRDRADARTTTAAIGDGILTVHSSAELGAVTVSFDAVPAPPDGSDYQLWLIDATGTPRSAGVLPELPAEEAPYVTEFTTSDQLAVTLEPDGGSPAPTTAPLGAVTLG